MRNDCIGKLRDLELVTGDPIVYHWSCKLGQKKTRVFVFWSRSRRSEGVRSSPVDMLRLSTYTLDFLKKNIFDRKKKSATDFCRFFMLFEKSVGLHRKSLKILENSSKCDFPARPVKSVWRSLYTSAGSQSMLNRKYN